MKRPILIVLTPVFNEAWILPAFLKATSLWADYIIIADQISTDGSRELYEKFESERCKLIVIDNPRKEMHQAATRRMLFEEAKTIEGDKILFALDADEFWSGDFIHTKSWERIIHSQPDDTFEFKWMNLQPGLKEYVLSPENEYYNWATHVSDDFFEGQYPENRFIHEWRLCWSAKSTEDKCFNIDDFRALHFCETNVKRLENKWKYYAVSSVAIPNKVYNMVSLYRQYHPTAVERKHSQLPPNVFEWYKFQGVDLLLLIDLNDVGQYYIDRILYYIHRDGGKKYAMLDIWDKDFCEKYNLRDPRTIWQKLAHLYLRATNKYASRNFIVRGCDKILRLLCKL